MGKGCVACGCLEYKVLLDLDCGGFDNSPLYEIVIVASCNECGHIYNLLTEKQIYGLYDYYRNEYSQANIESPNKAGDIPGSSSIDSLIRYNNLYHVIEKDIKRSSNVLDVGCAKGFLMKDLMDACPGLKVFGLDISYYAISNCMKDVKGRCIVENAKCLPFSDKSFDAIISINTLHNLEREDLKIALKEIERVSKGKSFVQLDAYQNDEELEVFKDWVLTAKTYLKPHEWEQLFQECGYTGDYFWTILSPDPKWTDFSSDKKTAPVWNTTA